MWFWNSHDLQPKAQSSSFEIYNEIKITISWVFMQKSPRFKSNFVNDMDLLFSGAQLKLMQLENHVHGHFCWSYLPRSNEGSYLLPDT